MNTQPSPSTNNFRREAFSRALASAIHARFSKLPPQLLEKAGDAAQEALEAGKSLQESMKVAIEIVEHYK